MGGMRARPLLLLPLLLLSGVVVPSLAAADPIIGERAPALAELPQKGTVIVDFYATWCGPCQLAMAALDEIVRRRGTRLVVVDLGEPAETVRAFVAAHPLPPGARLLLDEHGETARRWGARRLPTTFIVAEGEIVKINRGYGPGYPARLEAWIAALPP
jgi:cytochrome c biogenesis protein CcmG/thiol:disulfide interchange protein DsbE